MKGAAELALRTLRAAGDAGATSADLSKAGVPNSQSASPNAAGGGHVIDTSYESMGPPFDIRIARYRLVADRTPPLFEEPPA